MVAKADHQVAESLRAMGWSVLTSGWPDLLVYNPELPGGGVMAVELKRGSDRMRSNQKEMRKVFVKHMDIPFYVASDVNSLLRQWNGVEQIPFQKIVQTVVGGKYTTSGVIADDVVVPRVGIPTRNLVATGNYDKY
jgi:hypothetical protein|tara:strand:+ start:4321 stop:4728 length:408 start_codon:yes stop_codon:yes gene_type:complete